MGLREQLRRLPAIAWRDERIAELRNSEKVQRRQLAKTEAQLEQALSQLAELEAASAKDRTRRVSAQKYSPTEPSWHIRIMEQARVGRSNSKADGKSEFPRRKLLHKLHNYELARSHGVATPRVIGTWPQIVDIPWADLPDQFVVKSNRGYNSNGVLPLRRHEGGFRFLDSEQEITEEGILDRFNQARGLSGPYFVEEVLPGTEAVLPDDIKIYAFYGEVADVMLRRVTQHSDKGSLSFRFLDAQGQDLGRVRERFEPDLEIAVPRDLAHMIEVARVLSSAAPVPFVRVDLYQVPDGVMLGELTPLPGNSAGFTKEHDRRLGRLYDEAEGRLHLDLSRGRPYAVTLGPHDRDVTAELRASATFPE